MVAFIENARKTIKVVRARQIPRAPKDDYRDEGVAKVLKAARAPVIDKPMSASEMMRAIRRR